MKRIISFIMIMVVVYTVYVPVMASSYDVNGEDVIQKELLLQDDVIKTNSLDLMPLSEIDYIPSTHNAPCGCAVNVTMQVRITPNNRIEPLSLTATSEIGKKNDHYVYFELKSYSFSKKTSTSCTVTFTGYEWRSSLDAPNEWWIHDVGVRYSVEIMYPEL